MACRMDSSSAAANGQARRSDASLAPDVRAGNKVRMNNQMPALDFDLGEVADMLRDQVEAFAADEIAPRAAAIDAGQRIPEADLWTKLGAIGLLGVTVSPEHGGAGMGYLEHVVAMEEVSRASASVGLSYGAHSNLCGSNQIFRWKMATTIKWKRYLPKLISGEHVGALAMSEPGAGSDVVSMRLRADRRGDRYVLNGTKMWITNGPNADVLVIYAKTDPDAGPRGITAFLVEKAIWQGIFLYRAETEQARHARVRTPASLCSRTAKCPPKTCLARSAGA